LEIKDYIDNESSIYIVSQFFPLSVLFSKFTELAHFIDQLETCYKCFTFEVVVQINRTTWYEKGGYCYKCKRYLCRRCVNYIAVNDESLATCLSSCGVFLESILNT
jgi:hypothetical protein